MERSSFGSRAKQRIWQETSASAKGRVIPFSIGVIGIGLGYLINFFSLHMNTAKQLAILGAVSLSGSYMVWFLGAFVVNTLRVPWLLDAESTGLINKQEARAESAEARLDEINAARARHELFGRLVQQGADFLREIAGCQTDAHFASWDRHSNEWTKTVQQAMGDMGYLTDAVEFARAGNYAAPVAGIVNLGFNQETRRRRLEKRQEYLVNFVQRRLP